MTTQPFSLYVHIPFCTAKCTYCDFNSYAGQDSLMTPYAEAAAREAALWSPHLAGRQVETVFFGGGTPSLLPLAEMRVIVEAMRANFDTPTDVEFSLEANPGTVDAAHLQGLRSLGFNRISFGVQSFHEEELRRLERIHDAQEVEDAYRWAREAGFANVNLDLIYGLAGQTMEAWQTNLETALALGSDHLSLYALTLEEGTPLTRDVDRGRSAGPDLDLQADMFEWTRDRMTAAGFAHYEVSNWARPGRECRHNLVYWHNGDWLGLGAGAHSHLFDNRFAAAASPSRYIALVQEASSNPPLRGPSAEGPWQPLTPRSSPSPRIAAEVLPAHPEALEGPAPAPNPDHSSSIFDSFRQVTFREPADRLREMSETVILALRLREGLDLAGFEARFGARVADAFAAPLRETLDLGLTELVDGRLRLRDEAVLLGDEAFLRFLPDYDPA
ncbi:MAG: radical SAM family heme chaperone HemW [Dehalococcoidia bacterium]|nr:radical SAM family heme chaperone HemW [Dehalococcoidia bacterium]